MSESQDEFSALQEALRERLSIIADREAYQRDPQDHLKRLQSVSERIVSLQSSLPLAAHPQLRHYLERCSYDKALAYLHELCP